MFSAEFRESRSECWGSRWRPLGKMANGRPSHYVALTATEMAVVASTGRVSIPDHAVPAPVRRQRDRTHVLEKFSLAPELLQKVVQA